MHYVALLYYYTFIFLCCIVSLCA